MHGTKRVYNALRLALFLIFAAPCFHAFALADAPQDVLVFRVRNQDFSVENAIIATLRQEWNRRKSSVEQEWKTAVDGTTKAWPAKVLGVTVASYSVTLSDTSVALPDLPAFIRIERGPSPLSLRFDAHMNVNWTTNLTGSNGSVHAMASFKTDVALTGTIELGHNQNGYFLHLKTVGSSDTDTTGSIGFTVNILNLGRFTFTWRRLDLLLATQADARVEGKIKEELSKDDNQNGTPNSEEPYFVDGAIPVEALLFPVYSYLSTRNRVSYALTAANGTPVVEIVFGAPIVGNWRPGKREYPRLLYSAAERGSMLRRRGKDFKSWYSQLRNRADQEPAFAVPDGEGIISNQDWFLKEVRNAQIAAAAALVYDLEKDAAYLFKALRILFRFADEIRDPLFTPQWALKSLHTSEILTSLCQAYDLILGSGFPANVRLADISKIGLTPEQYLLVLPHLAAGKYRAKLLSLINQKFKKLRDVTYLETHIWDLLPNLNIAIRNASALGISALLFNQDKDAYENIGLAMSVIWKKLGLASSNPFNDMAQFTKVAEGEGYAEGPDYLNYTAELYLPFMWAYNKFNAGASSSRDFVYNDWVNQYGIVIPDMLTSERVRRIHEWGLKISLPNGRRPDVKDANKGALFYSGLLANASATPDPSLRAVWAWDFVRNDYFVGARLLDHFVAFDDDLIGNVRDPAAIYASPSLMLQDGGSVVFRSDWGPNAVYMHMLADHNWQGVATVGGLRYPVDHQQEDNSSFIVHAYGEPLAIDSGYGSVDVTSLVSRGVNHNLVVVDGEGPSESQDAFITKSLVADLTSYAEVQINYQSTGVVRHVLFLDKKYFVLVDELNSPSGHQYDWTLHGNGTYSTLAGNPVWTTASGRQLLVHVTNTSANGVDTIRVDTAAPHFSGPTSDPAKVAHHTSISAREAAARQLKYIATLVPSNGGNPLPVITAFSDGAGTFIGVKVVFPTYTDLIIVNRSAGGGRYIVGATLTGFEDIVSDAQVAFIRMLNSSKRVIGTFMRNAAFVTYGGLPLVVARTEAVAQKDSDSDGLMDDYEAIIGTNPKNRDSDGDGTSDGEEVANGTNPVLGNHDISGLLQLLLLGPVTDLNVNGKAKEETSYTIAVDRMSRDRTGCDPEIDFVGKFTFDSSVENVGASSACPD